MSDSGVKFIIGIVVVGLGLILLMALNPFVIVGPGERGVVMKLGQVQKDVWGEGMHFRTPFVESVEVMSVKVQKSDIKAEGASKDLQTVNTDIVVNWHLDATRVNRVYQDIGDIMSVSDKIIAPAVSETVKAATAKKTAAEVIAQRPLLKQDIDDILSKRLITYHVVLDDVSIVNVDFSPEFNKAINDKTVAVQNAQKAENDLKRIQIEAEQRVTTAKAEAEAIKIQTEALSQNQNLINLKAVEKWNGVLPVNMYGSAPLPFINIDR